MLLNAADCIYSFIDHNLQYFSPLLYPFRKNIKNPFSNTVIGGIIKKVLLDQHLNRLLRFFYRYKI